jgi:hypothetical protein
MGLNPAALALGEALRQVPTMQWPIQLTAKTPFHVGVAALVFGGPHVLSPADDVAEFGYPNPDTQDTRDNRNWFSPPYDGAQLVAWFRPPEIDKTYIIDFSCEGGPGGPFVLEDSDGNTEAVDIAPDTSGAGYATTNEHVSRTFPAGSHEWRWFALSCSTYWRFSSCELTILP